MEGWHASTPGRRPNRGWRGGTETGRPNVFAEDVYHEWLMPLLLMYSFNGTLSGLNPNFGTLPRSPGIQGNY